VYGSDPEACLPVYFSAFMHLYVALIFYVLFIAISFTASAIAATNPFACLSDVLPASIRFFWKMILLLNYMNLRLIHSQF
jgi:hypothetical protein